MNELFMVLFPLLAVSIGLPQPRPSIRIHWIPAQLPWYHLLECDSLCLRHTVGLPDSPRAPRLSNRLYLPLASNSIRLSRCTLSPHKLPFQCQVLALGFTAQDPTPSQDSTPSLELFCNCISRVTITWRPGSHQIAHAISSARSTWQTHSHPPDLMIASPVPQEVSGHALSVAKIYDTDPVRIHGQIIREKSRAGYGEIYMRCPALSPSMRAHTFTPAMKTQPPVCNVTAQRLSAQVFWQPVLWAELCPLEIRMLKF